MRTRETAYGRSWEYASPRGRTLFSLKLHPPGGNLKGTRGIFFFSNACEPYRGNSKNPMLHSPKMGEGGVIYGKEGAQRNLRYIVVLPSYTGLLDLPPPNNSPPTPPSFSTRKHESGFPPMGRSSFKHTFIPRGMDFSLVWDRFWWDRNH